MAHSTRAVGRPHFVGAAKPLAAAKGCNGSAYNVSDRVLVHSERLGWVQGTVNAIHRDGACDVQYDEGSTKQVTLLEQGSKLKPWATPSGPPACVAAHGRPHFVGGAKPLATAKGCNGSAYNVSDRVLVHSERLGWVQGTVNAIHRDGACDA